MSGHPKIPLSILNFPHVYLVVPKFHFRFSNFLIYVCTSKNSTFDHRFFSFYIVGIWPYFYRITWLGIKANQFTSLCSSSSEYVQLTSLPPIPFLSVVFNGALEYFNVHLRPSNYNYLKFVFILIFSLFSILFSHYFSLFTLCVNQNVLNTL